MIKNFFFSNRNKNFESSRRFACVREEREDYRGESQMEKVTKGEIGPGNGALTSSLERHVQSTLSLGDRGIFYAFTTVRRDRVDFGTPADRVCSTAESGHETRPV